MLSRLGGGSCPHRHQEEKQQMETRKPGLPTPAPQQCTREKHAPFGPLPHSDETPPGRKAQPCLSHAVAARCTCACALTRAPAPVCACVHWHTAALQVCHRCVTCEDEGMTYTLSPAVTPSLLLLHPPSCCYTLPPAVTPSLLLLHPPSCLMALRALECSRVASSSWAKCAAGREWGGDSVRR